VPSNRSSCQTTCRAICVDDGSTDGSPAILDEYAAKDSRFKVIHQENGDMERLQMWSHNIKWAILVRGTKALAIIMVSPDADKLVHYISDMVKTGLFENATTPVELKAKAAYYAVAAGQNLSE
jgi:hypothetical protein